MASGVICVGLSCLDMLLLDSGKPTTPESIVVFHGTRYEAGGSAPNTARALAELGVKASALTMVGSDPYGTELRNQMERHGVDTSFVVSSPSIPTALSILPVYSSGGRGCFVDLGCNNVLSRDDILSEKTPLLSNLKSFQVFHFGYPHLMEKLRGKELAALLERVRATAPEIIISVDVNGANNSHNHEEILGPVFRYIDVFHANLEEAASICGMVSENAKGSDSFSEEDLRTVATWFNMRGVGLTTITLGKDGAAFSLSETSRLRILKKGMYFQRAAFKPEGVANATGGGDAFVGGLLAALCLEEADTCTLETLADVALATAWQRVDTGVCCPMKYGELKERVNMQPRIENNSGTF